MKIINRDILSLVRDQLENDLALILIGARQVGKTTILRYLEKKLLQLYPKSKILYFNLENEDLLLHFIDYKSLVVYLKTKGVVLNNNQNKTFLLLDEFQKMPHPTKLLKLLYDEHPSLKVIATGSSSLDIYKKMREESMAGRKRIFEIFPLSFREFLRFQNSEKEKEFMRVTPETATGNIFRSEFLPHFNNYLIFGGYPRIALADKINEKEFLLNEIYNAYIQKDIQGILHLTNSTTYTKLVILLASQIGNLLSKNEVANTLGLKLSELEHYLFVLENTFIIKLLPPYFINKRKEITKMPKIYFLDNGLRNWAVRNFANPDLRQDIGQLAENFVFTELQKYLPINCQLFFWRTRQKAETDFILKRDEQLFPIEAKYKSFTRPIIPSGLKAFINNYHPKTAFALTKNFNFQTEFNGTTVYFLPLVFAVKIFEII